jgi:hypothetical protein
VQYYLYENKYKIINIDILLLATLFCFLSNINKKTIINKLPEIQQQKFIDKKASKLPAPKVYIYDPVQNGLEIGSNWRSK